MTKVKIYNSDCNNPKLLDMIEDKSIDVVFFSPPYNLGKSQFHKFNPNGDGTWGDEHIASNNKYADKNEDHKDDWSGWMEGIIRNWLKKSKYVFVNVQGLAGNKKEINTLLYKLNNKYCDTIIWNKGRGIPNGLNERVMTNVFEYIYVFSDNASRAVGTKKWKATQSNVINGIGGVSKNEYSNIHKAQFPIELPNYIFNNFVEEGGVVADIMMGLGTSGISAVQNGFDFIGVEMDKEYFSIAEDRIKKEWNKGVNNEII